MKPCGVLILVVLAVITARVTSQETNAITQDKDAKDQDQGIRDDKFHLDQPLKNRTRRQDDDAKQTLRVVTIVLEPYYFPLGDTGTYQGFIVDLIKEVASGMNVDYEFHLVKDGKYGSKNETGFWDGMVGEVTRGEADVAAAPMTITSMRARVVDFSKPFMNIGITTLVKRPTGSGASYMWLFRPFSPSVWAVLIIVIAVCCVIYYVLDRFVPKPQAPGKSDPKGSGANTCCLESSSLGSAVVAIFGISPRQSMSVSVLLISWRTFFLLTSALYLTFLMSFSGSWLSPGPQRLPYESLEDVVKTSSVDIGYVAGGSTETFFQVSKVPLYEQIYSRVSQSDPPTSVASVQEGVERVRAGNYVLLGESATFDYEMQKDCDLTRVGSNLNSVGYGLASPLGSKNRDIFSLSILELREMGRLEQLKNKWWKEKTGSSCNVAEAQGGGQGGQQAPKTKAPKPLSLGKFASFGSLVLLALGLALTGIVAVVEIVVKGKNKSGRGNANSASYQETAA